MSIFATIAKRQYHLLYSGVLTYIFMTLQGGAQLLPGNQYLYKKYKQNITR